MTARGISAQVARLGRENRELEEENAALLEIVRVVAEADNSDESVCFQLCNVHYIDLDPRGILPKMIHDAPCVVEKARELLRKSSEEVQ